MQVASITFYSLVLVVHICAVVIAFGVVFTYPLIVPLTRKTSPRNLPWLHRIQSEIGGKIIAPVGGLILLAGIYLALDGPYDFGEWWVGFGMVSIIVLLGVGGAFFGPSHDKMAELAERDIQASGAGEVTFSPEYDVLYNRVAVAGSIFPMLILATVFVMVLGSRGYLT